MLEIPATSKRSAMINSSEIGRDVHIYTLRILQETSTSFFNTYVAGLLQYLKCLVPAKLTLRSANLKLNVKQT